MLNEALRIQSAESQWTARGSFDTQVQRVALANGKVAREGGAQFAVERGVAGLKHASPRPDGAEVELATLDLDAAIARAVEIAALFVVCVSRIFKHDPVAWFKRCADLGEKDGLAIDASNFADERPTLLRVARTHQLLVIHAVHPA